jgi:hypothetical protein
LIFLFGSGGSAEDNHYNVGKPSDSAGNTYSQIGFCVTDNTQSIDVWMAVHAGSDDVSVTVTGVAYGSFTNHVVAVYRNANSPSSSTNPPMLTGIVQDSIANIAAGTDAITIGGSRSVPAQVANSLLVAACVDDGGGNTITAGTGFMLDKGLPAGSAPVYIESRVVNAGTYVPTLTPASAFTGGLSGFTFAMKADLPNVTSQQIAISADANDGGGYKTATAWNTTIAAGAFTDQDATSSQVAYVSAAFATPNYFADQMYMRFDTGSIIPANATIMWARLILWPIQWQRLGPDVSMGADYYDYGGSPPTSADWNSVSLAFTSDNYIINSIFVRMLHGTAMPGSSTLIAFHFNDISGIKRSGEANAQGNTGITGIRLFSDVFGSNPTGQANVQFATRENPTQQEPRLEVGWYVGAAAPEKQTGYYRRNRMMSRIR